jgi:hypothetical protein
MCNKLMYFSRRGARKRNCLRFEDANKIPGRVAMRYGLTISSTVNDKIEAESINDVEKLENTIRKKMIGVGIERAKVILTKFERNGVFNWAPQPKSWHRKTNYAFSFRLDSQPSNIELGDTTN